jgi:hypothetical protein
MNHGTLRTRGLWRRLLSTQAMYAKGRRHAGGRMQNADIVAEEGSRNTDRGSRNTGSFLVSHQQEFSEPLVKYPDYLPHMYWGLETIFTNS